MKSETSGTAKAVQTEALRSRIWDLYLGGDNQYAIAAKLEITQQNVSWHVRKCLTALRQNNATKAEQWLAREVEKCNYGEAEAWKSTNCQQGLAQVQRAPENSEQESPANPGNGCPGETASGFLGQGSHEHVARGSRDERRNDRGRSAHAEGSA